MRIWTSTLLAAFLFGFGCGGVNTSDDTRIGPRTAATGEEDDDDDNASVDEPADAALTPEPVDAGPPPEPPADAAPPVPAGSFAAGTELETTADLNLRSGPGVDFAVVVVMPNGSRVKVQTTSGADGWVHLDYDATIGYASKDFLKVP